MKKAAIVHNGKTLGEVAEGKTVRIGRSAECEVVLNSQHVSRLHATLTVGPEEALLKDAGSSHGILVNGAKIPQIGVKDHQTVQIGDMAIEIQASGYLDSELTPVPTQPPAIANTVPPSPAAPEAPATPRSLSAPVDRIDASHYQSLAPETQHGFSGAFGLVMKTWPYVLFRMGAYCAGTLAILIWYVLVFGVFGLMGSGQGGFGIVGLLVLVLPFGIAKFAFRYSLYLLKAGHIAVLTELIYGKSIPKEGMVEYGKDMVVKNLGQVSVLFVVDGIIKGVVRAFNRSLDWISSWIPIPGLKSLVGLIKAVIQMATTYIDECILSYNLTRRSQNVWASSADGLVLYAQNSKEILKKAAWAVVVDFLATAILYLVMLIPAGLLAAVSPRLGTITIFIALFLAFNLRAAFVRPLMLAYILMNYHVIRQGQEPNAEWQGKLHSLSGKFRELEDKAKSFVSAPQPTNGKVTA